MYGPLAAGATQVMYEGAPDWPDKGRFWELCEKYGVSVFYTAPTAIRAFMKWGEQWPAKYDLSKLRLLGTVGEPINPEAWIVVPRADRRRALPDRRHVVADGDRRDHDHAPPGRDRHEAGLGHASPFPASRRRSWTEQGRGRREAATW